MCMRYIFSQDYNSLLSYSIIQISREKGKRENGILDKQCFEYYTFIGMEEVDKLQIFRTE